MLRQHPYKRLTMAKRSPVDELSVKRAHRPCPQRRRVGPTRSESEKIDLAMRFDVGGGFR
jgi:hypothetical protein